MGNRASVGNHEVLFVGRGAGTEVWRQGGEGLGSWRGGRQATGPEPRVTTHAQPTCHTSTRGTTHRPCLPDRSHGSPYPIPSSATPTTSSAPGDVGHGSGSVAARGAGRAAAPLGSWLGVCVAVVGRSCRSALARCWRLRVSRVPYGGWGQQHRLSQPLTLAEYISWISMSNIFQSMFHLVK